MNKLTTLKVAQNLMRLGWYFNHTNKGKIYKRDLKQLQAAFNLNPKIWSKTLKQKYYWCSCPSKDLALAFKLSKGGN